MKAVTGDQTARALRVLLATPYGEDGMGGIDRLNDAMVDGFARQPELAVRCRRLVTRGKGSLAAAQLVFAAALAQLAASRREVDLLHIHLSVRGSSYRKAVLARAARLMGVPYVVHLHGTDYREFWQRTNPLLRAELGRMLAGSLRIIVLGRYWAEVMRELHPPSAYKIAVLPNATASAPAADRPDAQGTRIVFLGQLGQRKGSADLVQALARLSELPGWSAVMAGDGAIAETRALVAKLGLTQRVDVPGWVSTTERGALLRQSDVLVLPSYAENLPMVILEAFAEGVPVIATPVGAIPEVVEPGRTGLLVEPGDVAGLADAIRRIIAEPGLARRMGMEARRDHDAKFEINRYLRRLAGVWREAVEEASPRAGEVHAHPSEIR